MPSVRATKPSALVAILTMICSFGSATYSHRPSERQSLSRSGYSTHQAITSVWAKTGIPRTRRKMPSKGLEQTDESHQTCTALEDNARAPASNDQQSQRNNNGAPDSAPIALVERAGQHRHVVHNSGKIEWQIPELCYSRMHQVLVQMPDPCT